MLGLGLVASRGTWLAGSSCMAGEASTLTMGIGILDVLHVLYSRGYQYAQ